MTRLLKVYQQNEKISSLVSYLLVASMMFCLGITAADLIGRLLPDRELGYLPFFCFLVSLLGIYSQRKVRHASELDANPMIYKAVEWIVILVMLKLIIYAWNGMGRLLTDVPQWQSNFLVNFFQADYLLAIITVFLVWTLTLLYVEDLADLEGDVNLLQASTLDLVVINRTIVQARMANRVMAVGIGLVIVASLSRLDYSFLNIDQQLGRQNFLHVLAYFIFGLVLLSLTQLATRRAVWAWEQIPVGKGIARNWVIYSLGFLLVLSTLAFVLPTGYTLGFLPTLHYFLNLIFTVIYSLVVLVLLPFFLFIAWVLSLVGIGKGKPQIDIPKQILPPLPEAIASSPSPFLAILKAVVFWGTLILILGYSFYVYLRQNKELWEKIHHFRGFTWLISVWQWLVERAQAMISFVPKAATAGIERLRSSFRRESGIPRGGYLSLRRLELRQKIFFYYLALVRRSGEAGIPRASWQTPNQYAETLKDRLPDSSPEIETITHNFEEARYSQHPITSNQVSYIRRSWEHLRTRLKRQRLS